MIASNSRPVTLYSPLGRAFIWPTAPESGLYQLQGAKSPGSLVATIFCRATFVLPSCEGSFTGFV